jgi:hypothetical protein
MADQMCTPKSVDMTIPADETSSHGKTTNSITTAVCSFFYALLVCIIGMIVLASVVIHVAEMVSLYFLPTALNLLTLT